jgi:chemotaxis protein histidine kinase CheA
MKNNTVTVTAVIQDPEGKEIFRSEHTAKQSEPASGMAMFSSFVHPMELVLTDAHKRFVPDATAFPGQAEAKHTPGDDAIATGGEG